MNPCNLDSERGSTPISSTARFTISSDALELLKIDTFAAMAKALPDLRPENLEHAQKLEISKQVLSVVAKRILNESL